MLEEQAIITFYKIDKAGYYAHNSKEPSFGNISEILVDLESWAGSKELKQTKTYEANEDRYPCYLVDAKRIGNDWGLILWNQIPSNGQQIPSISETSKFGVDPSVILNPLQKGSIPGYATYFWFLTDRNLLATVKLHNKLTSQGSLQHYIHCFLKGSSEHVVAKAVTKEDGKVEVCISGYKKDVADEHEVQKHYNPGFTTSLVRNRGKHDIIRQNANNIKKIERVIELDVSKPEQLGLWQKMLQLSRLGGNNSQYADTSTKVRYTLSPHVTLEDLNAMIDDWESDPNEVNDYGFYLGGESNRPYWLSKSLARTEFGLNIERENVEFVQLNSLLNSLVSKKVEILKGAGII